MMHDLPHALTQIEQDQTFLFQMQAHADMCCLQRALPRASSTFAPMLRVVPVAGGYAKWWCMPSPMHQHEGALLYKVTGHACKIFTPLVSNSVEAVQNQVTALNELPYSG